MSIGYIFAFCSEFVNTLSKLIHCAWQETSIDWCRGDARAVSADAKSGLAIVPDLQALETWDEKEKKFRDVEN